MKSMTKFKKTKMDIILSVKVYHYSSRIFLYKISIDVLFLKSEGAFVYFNGLNLDARMVSAKSVWDAFAWIQSLKLK